MSELDEILDGMDAAGEEAVDVDALVEGPVVVRIRRAEKLSSAREIEAMWRAQARALSVRLALLQNPHAPESVLWEAWESLCEGLRSGAGRQALRGEEDALKALASNPRLPSQLIEEMVQSCEQNVLAHPSPISYMSVCALAARCEGLEIERRVELLGRCPAQYRLAALAALCPLYGRSQSFDYPWIAELLERQARDPEVVQMAGELVIGAAGSQGAVTGKPFRWIADQAKSARAVACCGKILQAHLAEIQA